MFFLQIGSICTDKKAGRKLLNKIGPYINSAQSVHFYLKGVLDKQTIDEIMKEESIWWSKAAKIMTNQQDAIFFICHWHNLDIAGHHLMHKIDPEATAYKPEFAEKAWQDMRFFYKAADRLVGQFLKNFDDKKTIFIVVSDHGMPANKKAVSLINLFLQRNWIQNPLTGQKAKSLFHRITSG